METRDARCSGTELAWHEQDHEASLVVRVVFWKASPVVVQHSSSRPADVPRRSKSAVIHGQCPMLFVWSQDLLHHDRFGSLLHCMCIRIEKQNEWAQAVSTIEQRDLTARGLPLGMLMNSSTSMNPSHSVVLPYSL